ncbi:MAG: hypothetical protein M0Z63_00925 [Actinomycetota bacterium]|nr:hypothetical protein [Actinomycetota bacterium]MDA8278988.1 hypothetical protein [Actinomycetota bacterium]
MASIASALARVLVPAMVGAAAFPTDGNRYGLGARQAVSGTLEAS